jgi:hypothetical protein
VEPVEEEPANAILLDGSELQTDARPLAALPAAQRVESTAAPNVKSLHPHRILLTSVALLGLFLFCSGGACLSLSLLLPDQSASPEFMLVVPTVKLSPTNNPSVNFPPADPLKQPPQLPPAKSIQPVTLAGPGISADWLVVFRSGNPAIWDSDNQQDENNLSRPLANVPNGIRYLRIRKDTEFVIIEMTKDRLKQQRDDGRYGWNGTNEFNWDGRHLGLFDKRLSGEGFGNICIRNSPNYAGWGFGHFWGVDKHQAYCWNGKPIPSAVLEIAVKPGELTEIESKQLRKHEVQTAPIQPATLAGDGISKDWQVIFCSANPHIWDQEVNGNPNHFARRLSGVADDVRYLRMRKDSDFVIVSIAKNRLKQQGDDGRFGWTGMANLDSDALHLGIHDKKMRCRRGDICIRSLPWFSGWGFGHKHFVNNDQGYCWDGKPIPPTVFEIAVKGGALTDAEAKKWLHMEK